MGKVYVGLDVGSSSCHLEAQDTDGAVVRDRKFDTSEANLITGVEGLKGEVWVHLETGELSAWIHRVLKSRVARVIVGHAKSSAWIAKDPLKRDRLDAHKLATLLRMGQVHEVYYADEEHRTVFKQIVQHYDDLTGQEARLKTKIKARLRAQGVIPVGTGVYGGEGRKAYLAKVSSAVAREAIEQLYGLLDSTLQAQKQARKLMKREAQRYPEIARFDEIPGVALVTACRFSAYVQTPHRFSSKRKLWRYCRLGVTDRTSDGKPLGRQALDWNGNGRLKDTSRKVFNGAMKKRDDNQFKRAYRQTFQRTHDATHARLSTQRKILAVMLAMWKGDTRYRDDKG
jgi:transposase